jgi:hypothetical protein
MEYLTCVDCDCTNNKADLDYCNISIYENQDYESYPGQHEIVWCTECAQIKAEAMQDYYISNKWIYC